MKRSVRSQRRGQGLTEYVILVGLIAIVLVTVVTRFKTAVESAYGTAARAIDEQVSDPIETF